MRSELFVLSCLLVSSEILSANPVDGTSNENSGNETITINSGETFYFDTRTLSDDGTYVDLPDTIRTYSNDVILAGGTLAFQGEGTINLTGHLSGQGVIKKENPGMTQMKGTSELTASTSVEISAGKFAIASQSAIGAAELKLFEGRLQNIPGQDLTLTNSILARAGGFATEGEGTRVCFSGAIDGSPFSKWGEGTLILSGNKNNKNLYLHVRGGKVELAKDGNAYAVHQLNCCCAEACISLAGSGTNQIGRCIGMVGGGTFDLNGRNEAVDYIIATNRPAVFTNNGSQPSTLTVNLPEICSYLSRSKITDGSSPLFIQVDNGANADLSGAVLENQGLIISNGNASVTPPPSVNARWVRFTILETRNDAPTNQYPNSGTQLSEFALTKNGKDLPNPPGTTVVSQNDFYKKPGEEIENLISGSVSDKWYGGDPLLIPAPIVFDYQENLEFDGYHWATANDAYGRDPLSWKLEVGYFLHGETNWVTLDTQISNRVTTARYNWIPIIPLAARGVPFPDNYLLDIGAKGILTLNQAEQYFGGLSGEGLVVLNDSVCTLSTNLSFNGNFGGEGKILYDQESPDLIPYGLTSYGITVCNQSAQPADITAKGNRQVSMTATLSDGFSPMGVRVEDQAELYLNSTNSTYSGNTTVTGGKIILSQGGMSQYFRMNITKTRKGQQSDCQLSEVKLMLNGAVIPWPEGTVVTTEAGHPTNEGPEHLIDGSYAGSDKLYMYNVIKPVIFKTPYPVTFDGYQWYTAGDSDYRDPVSWTFASGNDGAVWNVVDQREDFDVPTGRSTLAYTFMQSEHIPIKEFDCISDISLVSIEQPGSLQMSQVNETIRALSGNGLIHMSNRSCLNIRSDSDDTTFGGSFDGCGTLVKRGESTQRLSGAIGFSGDLVVEGGVLDLTGANLSNVTNIILRGGTLIGTATVNGDLTVTSAGGAYGATLNIAGALKLTGSPLVLASMQEGDDIHQTCFTYESTDQGAMELFRISTWGLPLPPGMVFSPQATDTQMRFSVARGGTILILQ